MNNKKLTKAIQKEFQRIAADMPRMYTAADQKTIQVINGATVLASGQKTVKGVPVNPDKTYTKQIDEGVRANHKKAMLKRYKEQGKEGVLKYMADVFEIEHGHTHVLRGLEDRINALKL